MVFADESRYMMAQDRPEMTVRSTEIVSGVDFGFGVSMIVL